MSRLLIVLLVFLIGVMAGYNMFGGKKNQCTYSPLDIERVEK